MRLVHTSVTFGIVEIGATTVGFHIRIRALANHRGAYPAGTVVVVYFGNTVARRYAIMVVINHGAGIPDIVSIGLPRAVPTRVVVVVVRRNPDHIPGCKDEPDGRPGPCVYEDGRTVMVVIIVVVVRADHIIVRVGFHDFGRAVEIFVSNDLDDGFPVAVAFHFDDGHVLRDALFNHRLDDDGMEVAFCVIHHPEVINAAIVVQVEVVDVVVRGVQFPLKIFQGAAAFEEVQSPFEAEIIAWQAVVIALWSGCQ